MSEYGVRQPGHCPLPTSRIRFQQKKQILKSHLQGLNFSSAFSYGSTHSGQQSSSALIPFTRPRWG